jgi:MmyB-like transcription regulator ligand binding domain
MGITGRGLRYTGRTYTGGCVSQLVRGRCISASARLMAVGPDIQIDGTGVQLIHHPIVGGLDLSFESFLLAADPSQMLLTYTAGPLSPSQYAPASPGPRPPTA